MDNPMVASLGRTMKMDADILIVGGGLNGSVLALALAHIGRSVCVIDQTPVGAFRSADFDGRAYAIALSSKRMLDVLGLWDGIAQDTQPMLDIKVSDGVAGQGASPLFVHFDHHEIEEGPMGHMVEDRVLRVALMDAIQAHSNITCLAGVSVVAQTVASNSVAVELNDGRSLSAMLLIGCDGRASPTAVRAGIKRTAWSYDQSSLVCAVRHEHPHNGCAHQFFTPAGPLAILPLAGGYHSSIVWTESTSRATAIQAMDDAGYLAELRPVFGSFLGDISLAGARHIYPLGLTIADRFVSPRIALLGDAAHGIHPLAGQGLNLGMRDIGALAEVLATAARRGEDIGGLPVLDLYQDWRRFDTHVLAAATDTINRVFSNDNSLLRGIRDLALGAVNQVPSLRRQMIKQAAGLSGDLPKLLQGRSI
jgi:2-octaprenyl-6-methoxyphenol hydroxylase